MDQLPNELLFNIFQLIPQRYKCILSTVCKQWNTVLSQPLTFNTIHIYSEQQLNKFIKLATKKTLINGKELIGNYVVHMHFHSYQVTKRKSLVYLVKHCPNLKTLFGLEVNYPFSIYPDKPFPPLNNLQHFYYWYAQYKSDEWVAQFLNNQQNLKTLELHLSKSCFRLTSNNSSSSVSSSSVPSSSVPSSSVPSSSVSSSTSLLPSLTSFIYFTSIGSLQHGSIFDSQTDFFSSQQYRIHVIKLPLLPSLTRLTLFFYENGDERIMETIHQSCPHLVSLTLQDLKMHISEKYIKNIERDHLQQQEFLKPHLSLKELAISNQLYDPKCYDYLSFKYPHLESLSLNIGIRHCPNEFFAKFKTAIYNMITRYAYLKKLKVKFGGGNFATHVWPHAELLYWLQKNPTQLTHLDYDYDYSKRILKEDLDNNYNHLNEQQIYYNMIPSPPSTSSTLSTNNNESIPFFQYHNYLNHLSSLTLHKNIDDLHDALYGFFLFNNSSNNNDGNSMIVSNSIEELHLNGINCKIYFWLDIFPNLKSYKISGSYSVKDGFDNDDKTIEKISLLENKDLYLSVRSQMEQNEQRRQYTLDSMKDSTSRPLTTTTTTNNNTHYYSLEKFEMTGCNFVEFKKFGWNGFFRLCPHLKTIILKKINRHGRVNFFSEEIRAPEQVTFDLSHLALDHLEIYRFNDASYSYVYRNVDHLVTELMIHEISLDKTYYVAANNVSQNESFHFQRSTTLNITCKYIDCLIFDNIENGDYYF
ncbi:unnamed protein product [Cunninghamella blakesleeana]